jgi:hypothetical protein
VKFLKNPFPLNTREFGGVVVNDQDLGVIGVSLVCVRDRVRVLPLHAARAADARVRPVGPADEAACRHPGRVMLAIGWGLAAMLSAVSGDDGAPNRSS